MKFKTHNNSGVNAGGTSLSGYLTANYDDLVTVFGEPHNDEGFKTDAGWDIEFEDGTIVTIYNWKNGKNYCGDEGEVTEEITDWNVGGNTNNDVKLLQEALALSWSQPRPAVEFDEEIIFLRNMQVLVNTGMNVLAAEVLQKRIDEKLAQSK